ncbi:MULTISPECIES: putative immunity protein [unclassified Methanoculleus]|uniref:putative immunity protein n=1 Tax=unclassified Methanoculleus TaxID=2619537 RepID=UPI00319E5F96
MHRRRVEPGRAAEDDADRTDAPAGRVYREMGSHEKVQQTGPDIDGRDPRGIPWAHAVARDAKGNEAACFAARAAGQAVAHVPQRAFGAAYYALKAVAAADPDDAGVNVAGEREWQARRLPEELREKNMRPNNHPKKG